MIRLPALFPVPLLGALALALPQQGRPTEEWLTEELGRSSALAVDELWNRAAELRAIGAEDLDAAAQALARAGELAPSEWLLVAALDLTGAEPDPSLWAAELAGLLDGHGEELARAAAGLLAQPELRALDRRTKADLLERLQETATDGDRDVPLRLAAAQALFQHGRGDERRTARGQMLAIFRSEDPELRAQGALALARAGNEILGELRSELERIASLPTPAGELAAAYLKQEDIRELSERKLKNQRRSFEAEREGRELGGTQGSVAEQFELATKMIQDYHLEGDQVDAERLLDAALDGMLAYLDEHSTYMSPEDYAEFEQELEAAYGGIGAYVAEDPEDQLFTITRPIFTGPAYRAGLLSDDKIVRIGDWPTIGESTDEIIKRLKGRPGTAVKLYIWRRGMDRQLIDRPTEDMAVSIVRESITIPPVKSQLLPGDIGMLELADFTRVASSELRTHALDLTERGAQAFILDLRLNSGGLLDEAVAVCELFLPKGSLVATTESRVYRRETHLTQREPVVPPDVPLVVLIDRFSASASEIVAGALRDHGRATLVGQRSYGKGSVQNLIRLRGHQDDQYEDENKNNRHDNWETITKDFDGDGEFDFAPRIKMTIARYLLPASGSIHRELDEDGNILEPGGVDPDIDVRSRRYAVWRLEEMIRIRDERIPRNYVDRHFDQHRDLFFELAINDGKDPSRYPDFERFYEELATPIGIDDLRVLVRAEIRRRVQDSRGREFPPGDFVEDVQVQAAIRELLARRGLSAYDIADYESVLKYEDSPESRIAQLDPDRRREILERIEAARKGEGELTPHDLRDLASLFAEGERR